MSPHDLASWAAFLSTVRVGGALPVTFRMDGDHVVAEAIVPYVTPERQANTDPNKIPLGIAEGFPIPISARYKLPSYNPEIAVGFVLHIVHEIYLHEANEQLRIGDRKPFAPEHTGSLSGQATIAEIKRLVGALPDEAARIEVLEALLENRCRRCLDFDPNGQFWCCHESRDYGGDD